MGRLMGVVKSPRLTPRGQGGRPPPPPPLPLQHSGLASRRGALHLAPRLPLCQGVFAYCGVHALVDHYHFLDTMLIFLLYGWSVLPLMYLASYLFSSGTSAFIKLTLFNYFSTVFSIVLPAFLQYEGECAAPSLPPGRALFPSAAKTTLP